MIRRIADIRGVDETVITPIIKQVCATLNKNFIHDDDAFNNMEYLYNNENATMPDNIYDNAIGGSTVDINVEITDDIILGNTNSTFNPTNKLIFLDKVTGYSMRPLYTSTNMEITYTYRCQSKQRMTSIKNNFRMYYDNSSYRMLHDLEFSYLLPNNVLELTSSIAELRGLTLDEYIDTYSIYKLDKAVTRNSKNKVPVFRGKQNNIIGNIMTAPDDIKITKSDAEYILEFTYKLTIQKPTTIVLEYPIMVNNTKIPDKWLPQQTYAKSIETATTKLNISSIVGSVLSTSANNNDVIYRIPTYDNFIPWDGEHDLYKVRLVSLLLTVDFNNRNFICNIDDLKRIGLPKCIIDYFKDTEKYDLFNFGNSLFLVELFEGKVIKDYKMFKDDENNIVTTKELNGESVYHLLISIVSNLDFLTYNMMSDQLARDKRVCDELNIGYVFNNENKHISIRKTSAEFKNT